ncbi:ArnT family glycosyltransferase [[Limnothrix rosea] IAM M-220]|uniref:ArnT family glycosyltransferase n=1 Tax=[Limnothrix rosea] IAM M-220 TaxID=454133 RepID=UPI001CED2135|nr:glycosyltransferase family 39 protein [[Limnothrix rosea] IAM M-220]
MRLDLKGWSDRRIIFLLAIAALCLFCFNLGNVPLRDWDEGTRAVVAREIFRTGNWLHPTIFGESYFNKPPLMDWLVALLYKVAGVNEWTSRLPGAIATALGVPLLFCLGREIFAHRRAAVGSALVYLTLLPVVRHGRLLMLDGMVMTALILAFWCLLKSSRKKNWGLGFGIGLGIIALTKGLLMLPLGAIALIFVLWDRRWSVFQNRYIWLGLAVGLLPTTVWYGAQIQEYGDQFIQAHFLNQGFERIGSAVERHQHPPWFFLLELLKYSAPWLLFSIQSYIFAWQNQGFVSNKLILSGSLFYFGLISVMGTKLPWYIMPFYPFFALAIGQYLTVYFKFKNSKFSLYLLFYFLAIAAYGGTLYFIVTDPQISLILLAIVVGTMFLWAGRYWQQRNVKFQTVLIIGMYGTLMLLFSSQSWLWEINETFAAKPVGELIRNNTPENVAVFTTFGYRRPSLDFYGDRPILPKAFKNLKPNQYWLMEQEIFGSPGLTMQRW